MRILVVSNYNSPIYSIRPEAEIFVGLQKKGVEVDIMSYPDAPYRERFLAKGIRFIPFHPDKKWDPNGRKLIRQQLLKRRHDLLHLFNKKAITTGIAAVKGLPVKVITYRGVTGYSDWYDPTSYLSHLHPRVDGITCVSQSATDYLKKQFWNKKARSKVKTVYKGHDLGWYDGVEPFAWQLNGLKPNDKIGICVANIRKMKGLKYLLQATSQLVAQQNFHLVLVGEGMNGPEYQRMIEDSPMAKRIHLLGYRKDVLELIKASDFLVLPSIKGEGLPKVVIEAMAQEVTPIASRVGGCPELIEHMKSGIITIPGNPESISNAIKYVLHHPGENLKMGELARERIASHFTLQQSVDRMQEVYREWLS